VVGACARAWPGARGSEADAPYIESSSMVTSSPVAVTRCMRLLTTMMRTQMPAWKIQPMPL